MPGHNYLQFDCSIFFLSFLYTFDTFFVNNILRIISYWCSFSSLFGLKTKNNGSFIIYCLYGVPDEVL